MGLWKESTGVDVDELLEQKTVTRAMAMLCKRREASPCTSPYLQCAIDIARCPDCGKDGFIYGKYPKGQVSGLCGSTSCGKCGGTGWLPVKYVSGRRRLVS